MYYPDNVHHEPPGLCHMYHPLKSGTFVMHPRFYDTCTNLSTRGRLLYILGEMIQILPFQFGDVRNASPGLWYMYYPVNAGTSIIHPRGYDKCTTLSTWGRLLYIPGVMIHVVETEKCTFSFITLLPCTNVVASWRFRAKHAGTFEERSCAALPQRWRSCKHAGLPQAVSPRHGHRLQGE